MSRISLLLHKSWQCLLYNNNDILWYNYNFYPTDAIHQRVLQEFSYS